MTGDVFRESIGRYEKVFDLETETYKYNFLEEDMVV
jgi:hypothetical protein